MADLLYFDPAVQGVCQRHRQMPGEDDRERATSGVDDYVLAH